MSTADIISSASAVAPRPPHASPRGVTRIKARDVMTTNVVSVDADTPTRDIARVLLEKHISAVPVLDAGGAPIGMVSEGDLIGRDPTERAARRDWWLALLAEGEPLSPEFLATLQHTASDVMSRPVV